MELDDSILDLMPGEADDFEGVNLDFVAALLADGRKEIGQHITETYNPEAEKSLQAKITLSWSWGLMA